MNFKTNDKGLKKLCMDYQTLDDEERKKLMWVGERLLSIKKTVYETDFKEAVRENFHT